jgi:dimethylhistidine N-methyltransferase
MSQAIPKDFALTIERSRGLSEIWSGLSREPKRLPCKLFYDAQGSRLFEQITRLPEYYPTRTEIAILERHGSAIAERLGTRALIVEFGSGASVKTRLLLDALQQPRAYIPIDISREMLLSSASALDEAYPELDVRPVHGDYMGELDLPLTREERLGNVTVFFPGSTIGNFEQDEVVHFLRRLRRSCGDQVSVLIGVDVPKERAILEAAYDDASGVTARFNLNALRVLNREYGAHFRIAEFEHRAVWNAAESRVEMHLVSRRDQHVSVGGRTFSFRSGEPIVTEHCYKYGLGAFRDLVQSAGFDVSEVWLDEASSFSVQLLVPA